MAGEIPTSCSVCYESWDYEDANLVPRKLQCPHIVCTGCLQEAFEGGEESVQCPECLSSTPCIAVNSLPILPQDAVGAGSEAPDTPPLEVRRSTSDEGAKRPSGVRKSTGGFLGSGTSYTSFLNQIQNQSPRRHSHDLHIEKSDRFPTPRAQTPQPAQMAHRSSMVTPPQMTRKAGVLHRRSNSFNEGQWRFCHQQGCQGAATITGYCDRHSSKQQLESLAKLKADFSSTRLNQLVVDRSEGGRARIGMSVIKHQGQSNLPHTPNFSPKRLAKLFYNQERLQLGEAIQLIDQARDILIKEPNVLSLEAPMTVVGDLHGQFYDLLHLLKLGGEPGEETRYLFLGDYVDRGAFSCEVILYLLALKVAWPDQVYLLRGNHECRDVCAHFGFKEECAAKYGLPVYYRFLLAFQTLPLAAELKWSVGKFFACHGGLSPQFTTVAEIENMDRFREPELGDALLDILWADPVNDQNLPDMSMEEITEFLTIGFRSNAVRGCSYVFGYAAIKDFLEKNGFLAMIRAHEVQEDGQYGHFDSDVIQSKLPKFFNDDDPQLAWPPVLTVFSAPNYCGTHGNQGAMLTIQRESVQIQLYDCVESPAPKDQEASASSVHLLVTGNSCPYMPTSFRELVRMAIEVGPALTMPELERQHTSSGAESPTKVESSGIQSPPMSSPNQSRRTSVTFGMAIDIRVSDSYLTTETDSDSDEKERYESSTKGPSLDQIMMPPPPPRPSLQASASPPPKLEDALSSFPSMGRNKRSLPSGALKGAAKSKIHSNSDHRKSAPLLGRRSLGSGAVGGDSDGSNLMISTVPKRTASNLYKFAHARDSINEMHPEVLNKRIKGIQSEIGELPKPGKLEKRMSVREIRDRFETLSKKAGPEIAHSTKRSSLNGKPMQPSPSHKKELSLVRENLQTSGRSVKDLVRHFMRRNEKENITPTPPPRRRNLAFSPHRFRSRSGSLQQETVTRNSESDAKKEKEKEENPLKSHVQNLAHMWEHWTGVLTGKGKNEEEKEPAPKSLKKGRKSLSESSLLRLIEKDSMGSITSNDRRPFLDREKSLSSQIHSPDHNSSKKTYFTSPVKQLKQAHAGAKGAETVMSSVDDNGPPTPKKKSSEDDQRKVSKFEQDDALTISEHEFYALRLIFAIFDRSGKNFISRDDLHAFAEEQGDYAQQKEVDFCMTAIDSDKDGKIDLNDFIMFAIRLRHLHKIEHKDCEFHENN